MSIRVEYAAAPAPQAGSALIVTLVFLVIFTILGLAAMGTSRLELKMAANAQYTNQAFQAAESGIGTTLRDTGIYSTVSYDPAPYYFNQASGTAGFDDGTSSYFNEKADTETTYLGTGNFPSDAKSSVGLGVGMTAHHFTLDSIGESQTSGRSVHQQGYFLKGPN